MKHVYHIAVLLLLTFVMAFGCGSEAESVIKDHADATENYVNALSSAKNSKEVVTAIEDYTEDMKKIIPELKAFQEKHPEYEEGKIPAGMETDVKRLEEISEKLPGAMMKITSYMMDKEVQSAMQKMGEEMSRL